jgi:hypothetical protein
LGVFREIEEKVSADEFFRMKRVQGNHQGKIIKTKIFQNLKNNSKSLKKFKFLLKNRVFS